MIITHLLFLMEVVSMQGTGQLNLSNNSKLDEPSCSSLLSSTCRASYLLGKGTWEDGVVTEGTYLYARQELTTIPHHLLCQRIEPSRERIGNLPYHVSCLPDRPVPGKIGCSSSSLSLSHPFLDTEHSGHTSHGQCITSSLILPLKNIFLLI